MSGMRARRAHWAHAFERHIFGGDANVTPLIAEATLITGAKTMTTMPQKIESTYAGSVLYRIVRAMQLFQSGMAWLIWPVTRIIVATLSVSKTPAADGERVRVVDRGKRWGRFAGRMLMGAVRIQQWIAGMHRGLKTYERLLTWTTSIPLLGYRAGSVSQAIEIWGPRHADGSHGWDMAWLTRHLPHGRFQILTRQVDLEGGTTVTAVWLTGTSAGRGFVITGPRDFAMAEYLPKDHHGPTHVYFPPWFVIFLFHLTLSAGFAVAALSLGKEVWKGLLGFGQHIWSMVLPP